MTALSLTACVLLVALWVRSYWWFDSFGVSFGGNRAHWLGSGCGAIRYGYPFTPKGPGVGWKTYDTPAREWVKRERRTPSFLGFRWPRYPIMPHWFPVLITAMVAIAPWITWRFSLRTLLIASTLIAVVLGIVVAVR